MVVIIGLPVERKHLVSRESIKLKVKIAVWGEHFASCSTSSSSSGERDGESKTNIYSVNFTHFGAKFNLSND